MQFQSMTPMESDKMIYLSGAQVRTGTSSYFPQADLRFGRRVSWGGKQGEVHCGRFTVGNNPLEPCLHFHSAGHPCLLFSEMLQKPCPSRLRKCLSGASRSECASVPAHWLS